MEINLNIGSYLLLSMDVLTVAASAVISALTTICLMFVFYSRWILPYLTKLTNSIPEQVKTLVFPYVEKTIGETIESLKTEIGAKVAEVSQSVKTTSARFNRTVKQAESYLAANGIEIDPDNDESVENARNVLSPRYGLDVATQAIGQLVTSIIENRQKAAVSDGNKAANDGW